MQFKAVNAVAKEAMKMASQEARAAASAAAEPSTPKAPSKSRAFEFLQTVTRMDTKREAEAKTGQTPPRKKAATPAEDVVGNKDGDGDH